MVDIDDTVIPDTAIPMAMDFNCFNLCPTKRINEPPDLFLVLVLYSSSNKTGWQSLNYVVICTRFGTYSEIFGGYLVSSLTVMESSEKVVKNCEDLFFDFAK